MLIRLIGGAPAIGGAMLAVLFGLSAWVQAAEIRVAPERSATLRKVSISGPIQRADVHAFARAVSRARAATVELASVGGDPEAALQIARLVRQRGFETVVPAEAECAGACAVIWLAGTTRSAHRRASVRLHIAAGLERPPRVDLVTLERAIHVEFGHPMDLAWAMTRAPAASARDLTPELARNARLEVVWLSGADDAPVPSRSLPRASNTDAARAAAKEAVAVVRDLMRWIRLGKPLTDGIVAHFYAGTVRYHGEAISRGNLMMRQRIYRRPGTAERLVLAGEPDAACAADGSACTVVATANHHGERDAWGRTADAVLSYRFVLRRDGGRMRIVEEERHVLRADPRAAEAPEARLTRRIQAELMRLGCREGPLDGWWDFTTADGLARFHEANGSRPVEDGPTARDLRLMEANPGPICR